MVLGIDVSHHNGSIDWQALKASRDPVVSFAFLKATEGQAYVSRAFRRNWERAHAAGMLCGAYHFYLPSRDPRKQAANFIRRVELRSGDLFPVLDIERKTARSKKELAADLRIWLDVVGNHYGVPAIIYTGSYYWNEEVDTAFAGNPLWIAHYTGSSAPRLPRTWKEWEFWQYTDRGKVPGIRGPVDMNRFRHTRRELRRFTVR